MADMLATVEDLASLLQVGDLDRSTATLLIETATARVQAAAGGQRIVDLTDTALIDVDDPTQWSQWLDLPQYPIRSVATVVIDGAAVTDFLLRKQKLWRLNGWLTNFWSPSQTAVTYSHGYQAGSQYLQLGRQMTLSLAASVIANPSQLMSEAIDDYKVQFAEAASRMELSEFSRKAIRDAYGVDTYVTVSAQD